jgi:hypothetical protein
MLFRTLLEQEYEREQERENQCTAAGEGRISPLAGSPS